MHILRGKYLHIHPQTGKREVVSVAYCSAHRQQGKWYHDLNPSELFLVCLDCLQARKHDERRGIAYENKFIEAPGVAFVSTDPESFFAISREQGSHQAGPGFPRQRFSHQSQSR
ncbi:MAG: hypothetical protein ACXAE3_11520 [Candidatus Kariarchaeaceae archaeon]|jgi:hypothetical protein